MAAHEAHENSLGNFYFRVTRDNGQNDETWSAQ